MPTGQPQAPPYAWNPYRSIHFVPASRPDWVGKADAAGADAIVIDLEDSVPPNQRAAARRQIKTMLSDGSALRADLWVRTLDVDNAEFEDDLAAVVHEGLTGVLLPKTESAAQVVAASSRLLHFESMRDLAPASTALIVSPESPAAIRDLGDILRADRRVVGVGFAGADGGDLCNALGISQSRDRREVLYLRSRVQFEAVLAGCRQIIESVWVDLNDPDGFAADCQLSRRMGYTGRGTIHPDQITAANAVYGPGPQQIADARALLTAYREAAAAGQGAVRHRGRMIDAAMAEGAERFLKQLGALDAGV
ncbi:hypothetical protein GRC12_00290 [Streptomyces griseorubiginosus]|nr:hypothetical protein [Streptomyces griseorubiginosus]